ncbi:MAG: hypothetical protein ABIP55_10450 [Tepidisphaeraceae bacterium]
MKQMVILSVLAAGMAIGCESMKKHEHAEHHDKHHGEGTKVAAVAMADVPAAVSGAFQKAHPGVKVGEVKKETYQDGTVHYEFEFTDAAGKKQEVEYSSSGEALDAH